MMHLLTSRRGIGTVIAVTALSATMLTPLASASAASPSTHVVTLTSKKTVGVPKTLAPGYHTFVLKESAAQANKDPRGLGIVAFAKGYTLAMFKHDLAVSNGNGPLSLKAYARVVRNARGITGLDLEPDYTVTGNSETVLLKPGHYYLDNNPSANGAPDVYTPLTVTKAKAVGAKPKTVGTITSSEFKFKLTGVRAGKHLYALHDAGAQLHMYQIFRVDKGHTLAEIKAALMVQGPPPAWLHNGGFAGILSGKQTMFTTLNFSPKSNYLLICFMPDVKTGAPHFSLGMLRLFSVK